MASILVASCRNRRGFAQVINFCVRGMPLAASADFRRSRVDTVRCLPILQRHNRNHFVVCSAVKRCQSAINTDISLGCVRKISSSKIMYTNGERDKGSGTTVSSSDSSSEDDDTVSSDSADDSLKISHFEGSSTDKAQPMSDVDVDKELLRYDYEEFELLPEEQESIVRPVKKSVPVELTSK